MRFTLFVLLLAGAVGCGASGDTKKDDTAASPDQQFADLQKRYFDTVGQFQQNVRAAKSADERKKLNDEFQPKHEKLAAEALALAKGNPKAGFCLEAVMMAAQDTTTDKEALRFAVDTFADDKKILDLVPMLTARPDAGPLLAKLGESKSREVRAGMQFLQITGEIDRLDADGKAKPADLQAGYAAAGKKLDALVKEHGDVSVTSEEGPAKLSDAAKSVAYMLEHLTVGKTLADVDCPTLDGDKPAKISEYRGKVVVLDIWATWCGPCKAMIPHERDMVKKLEGKPFALISVSADDTKETLTKFLETTPMPWAHWHAGPRGDLLRKYQVKFFPTIFVLDAKGVIRHKNLRNQELEHAVEELLKETEKK